MLIIRQHLDRVYRAPHAPRALIQHMGIDYSGRLTLLGEMSRTKNNECSEYALVRYSIRAVLSH
jgi:hypothetical protein